MQRLLYTKRHALQHYMELAEKVEHPRLTVMEFMKHMAKTATEVYAWRRTQKDELGEAETMLNSHLWRTILTV